jgi:hypothetical protein
MALTEAQSNSGFVGSFELEHCTASEHFSRMWSFNAPDPFLFSVYGPHRVLSQESLDQTVEILVEAVRELWAYDVRQLDVASVTFHRDERECRRESELQQIANKFNLRGRESVCHFLEQNRFLIKTLFEVRKKFDQYFSSDTHSALEVFTDPEDNNSVPKLFALILTTLSSDDASTRLDRLDQEWWLDQPHEVRRVLNIDVDYVDGV